MEKSIISEGKTTNEAIEKGLKQLKVCKENVEIKVLENEEKRSFFSILEPRVVKVELTIKEKSKNENKPINQERRIIEITKIEQDKAEQNLNEFLNEFIKKLDGETIYNIKKSKDFITIEISNPNLGYLIGYRGETLYAFQDILTSIASKGVSKKVRVSLDIEGYKEKREKTLKDLAEKVAKTVIRTGKEVKLEPMKPYERKIIHSELQNNSKVETISIGEEPRRRLVVYPKGKKTNKD